ncbi:MAG: tail fiber protein [SAR324 cluster bacterium]|nr:tail fiber protein [SAR324 cluster bacterium]
MENREIANKFEQLEAKLSNLEQSHKTRRFFHIPSTIIGILVASFTLAIWTDADTPTSVTANSFTSGTVISSSKINANFTAVFTAINELLAQIQVKSGNVGIGTTSPAYKLDVVGTSNMQGKIQSQDIVAATDNSYELGSSSVKWKKVHAVDVSLPPGLIMPSAVPGHNTTPPTGWLYCEGSAVSRTTYADLFTAIGTTYGSGDGSTTFNLPDYRGYFLRGMADGQTKDPDRATRTDRGDGITGDVVGTKQPEAVTPQSVYVKQKILSFGTTGTGASSHTRIALNPIADEKGYDGTWGNWADAITGGGNETRPLNINVVYLIKY